MAEPTAVFSSWHGRHSDNPRAISDELLRRGAAVRQVWIVPDEVGTLPDGVERVRPGSADERRELERARWIVSNDVLPGEFTKAPDATYLQTWHGTPLKRIAYDVLHPRFPDSEYHYSVELGRDIARWDVLLSPNRFSTGVLPRAFRFDGPVLETGYPRNDVLLSRAAPALRASAREALGLDDSTRAVLYAPTWRDDFTMEIELDLDALYATLGDDVVFLIRAHWLVAGNAKVPTDARVRDVTSWAEASELYLAADALLTDYSSTMFDFALTGKPLVLYTYDLEQYRDEVRGFYFDLATEAPGPLLRTAADVAAAVRDLDAVAEEHALPYGRFRDRYGHREDGSASARVVDAVFGDEAPGTPEAEAASQAG